MGPGRSRVGAERSSLVGCRRSQAPGGSRLQGREEGSRRGSGQTCREASSSWPDPLGPSRRKAGRRPHALRLRRKVGPPDPRGNVRGSSVWATNTAVLQESGSHRGEWCRASCPGRAQRLSLPRGGQGPRAVPPRSREEAYAGTSLTTSLKEENFTCRGCFLTRFYYEKVQIAKSFPGTSVSPPPQCGRYVSLSLPRDTRVRLPLPPAARLLGLATTFDVSGKFAGPRLRGVLGICLSALRLCPDLPFLCPVPTGRRLPGRTVLQLLGGSDKSRRWLREMGAESGCFYYLPLPSPPPPLSLRLGWPQLDYKGLPIHPSGVPAPRRHARNDPAPTMWPRDPGSLRCWSQGPPATPPSSSFLAGLSLKGEPGSQPHTRDSKRPFGESCRSHPEGPCAS